MNKEKKWPKSKKQSSSISLVPLCLLLPFWLSVTMPFFLTKNLILRIKALFLRMKKKPPDPQSLFILSPVIEPMEQEPFSELQIKAWLNHFNDPYALECGRSHLENCYVQTLYLIENPPCDDPLY